MCLLALSLRVNPMPPRITQQSRRPRGSDRTMVALMRATASACQVSRSRGVVTDRTKSNRYGKTRTTRASHKHASSQRELEVTQLFSLPVDGEVFFLTFPFYRTDEMRRPVSG